MKRKLWTGGGAALCALLSVAGCDVHRTDPVPEIGQRTDPAPEIAPLIGQPEKEADRTRPATREGAEVLDARDRQSRIDDTPGGAGDARLASEVESALAAEPALRGSSIAVHSEDGVVTLRGATSDSEGRILAAYVARAVQGVRLVRNELAEAGKA
jgi:hypothetical protein